MPEEISRQLLPLRAWLDTDRVSALLWAVAFMLLVTSEFDFLSEKLF